MLSWEQVLTAFQPLLGREVIASVTTAADVHSSGGGFPPIGILAVRGILRYGDEAPAAALLQDFGIAAAGDEALTFYIGDEAADAQITLTRSRLTEAERAAGGLYVIQDGMRLTVADVERAQEAIEALADY